MLPEQFADHKRRIVSKATVVRYALAGRLDDALEVYNQTVSNMGANEISSFYEDVLSALNIFMYKAGMLAEDQINILNKLVDTLPAVRNRKVTKINFLVNQLLRISASRESFHNALNQLTQEEVDSLTANERDIYNTAKLNVALHTGDLDMLVAMTNE